MRFLGFIFFTLIFSAFQSDNKILWKENNLLTWDDFKGKPASSSTFKALTESVVTVDIKSKGNEAIVIIKTYFDKSNSWTKDKENDILLSHEQRHFNITEIWTRKFRQKLSGKSYPMKAFQKELNSMHSEIHKESKSMQFDYDKETQHSVNASGQQKWNKKITNELQKLSDFSSNEVTCKLSK